MPRPAPIRRVAGLLLPLLVLGAAIGTAPAAAASVPTGVEVLAYPDGDGVLVTGTAALRGRVARLEVHRGGAVVGSVAEPVTGDSLTVNRPGGWCWGSGTGLAVTPDLTAGDVVDLTVDGTPVARTVVAAGRVDPWPTLTGTTVTFRGEVPPGSDPARVEHHVDAARLAATDLVRRDVTARSGPPARAVSGGYASGLVVGGGNAVATYVVDRPETAAALAAAGGARLLVRADADSGPTVLDGARGGPAAAACPGGPDVLAPAPPRTVLTRRSPDRSTADVSWTPAPSDTPPSAWEVRAVAAGGTGAQPVIAVRVPGVATTVALTGLVPTTEYSVEVRAVTGAALGPPLVTGADAPAGGTRVDGDGPPAPPAPTPDGVGLRLAVRAGTQVYFTTDGSSPRAADGPAPRAQLYTGLVLARAPRTTVSWVAVDDATGAVGDTGTALVGPPPGG